MSAAAGHGAVRPRPPQRRGTCRPPQRPATRAPWSTPAPRQSPPRQRGAAARTQSAERPPPPWWTQSRARCWPTRYSCAACSAHRGSQKVRPPACRGEPARTQHEERTAARKAERGLAGVDMSDSSSSAPVQDDGCASVCSGPPAFRSALCVERGANAYRAQRLVHRHVAFTHLPASAASQRQRQHTVRRLGRVPSDAAARGARACGWLRTRTFRQRRLRAEERPSRRSSRPAHCACRWSRT